MDKVRNAIVQEARELLDIMDRTLARVSIEGDDTDSVNEVFRAVHTIKGSAGLLAFERIVSFAHLLESVLDSVRSNNVELAQPLLGLLVDCGDYIAELVDAIAAYRENIEPDAGKRATLEHALQGVLAGHQERFHDVATARGQETVFPGLAGAASLSGLGADNSAPPSGRGPDSGGSADDSQPLLRYWRAELRFGHDMLRSGMDPIGFLRSLESLGRLLEVDTHTDSLPPAAGMDPESCYLRFTVLLQADCGREAIENVFEFVRDDSDVKVFQVDSPHGAPVPDSSTAADAEPGGLRDIPAAVAVDTDTPPRRVKSDPAYVKIPVDRLDALIDLVGELVISGASATDVARREQNPAFQDAAQAIEGLVGQIRDTALKLRMIPIGEVFQRFPRVVRGVARQLGKDIRLTMMGADTELDKSMMEKLSEPLMHIVRNAIDHGLEPASERLAAGKPAAGTLHLAAYHDSGSIVIEVSDDGRGLDYALIRRKAVERGLLDASAPLSDEDASLLLFEPGFSTRERVTRLSGRGVGMDIVRQSIESLRGATEIISREGRGTVVRIRLPLTLAIIDGFMVEVGDSTFVIPMDMMVECLDLCSHASHDSVVELRGEPLPYVRLRDVFGLPPAGGVRENMVVVQYGRRQRAGLVVDKLMGEFQTVIRPLGVLFDKVGSLSGSTILGDGRVALILDVPQLIQRALTAGAAHADAGGDE